MHKKGFSVSGHIDFFGVLRLLMHKNSFSVFEHIVFFGVLHHLIGSLWLCLELEWVMPSLELSKVVGTPNINYFISGQPLQ